MCKVQWFFKYIRFVSTQQATLVKKPLISESWLNYMNYQDIYFKATEKNQSTLVRCLWQFYNLTPTFFHILSSRESVPHTLLWTRMAWWLLWPIKYGRNVTMWLLRLSLRRPCRFCFLLLGHLLIRKPATMWSLPPLRKPCWKGLLVTAPLSFQQQPASTASYVDRPAWVSPKAVWQQSSQDLPELVTHKILKKDRPKQIGFWFTPLSFRVICFTVPMGKHFLPFDTPPHSSAAHSPFWVFALWLH